MGTKMLHLLKKVHDETWPLNKKLFYGPEIYKSFRGKTSLSFLIFGMRSFQSGLKRFFSGWLS